MLSKVFSLKLFYKNFIGIAIGAFLAAAAIRIFLIPNHLIDGGIVGLALISARLFGSDLLSYFLIAFNLPFVLLAYRSIRKTFVINMGIAIALFAFFLALLENVTPFQADPIEIIVIGGSILGIGVGLMIRNGGCTDGTEIMGIILNRKMGFTIGQIVLFINIFIFSFYGLLFQDWHIALHSLIIYVVAVKMIDMVIAGLEEVKSVLIMTNHPKKIKELIMNELGLGLTIIPGIGGFSGKERNILFVIVERLDLGLLKEIVLNEDPEAFMAIENLHEVAYGRHVSSSKFIRKNKKRALFGKI
ncbi:MAG: YitT family protein [Parachlamydiales bacterium]|jgi:uncharacterized membrane-anchored protein YitT (DUF2179 family)